MALVSTTGSASELEHLLLEDVPVRVLTPARLLQSLHDVPASVTVIDSKLLEALQIRTVPDALRLVPGMIVSLASGNEYRINYHGTNGLIPRRMQVLIDGMSVYKSGFAFVDWATLPVAIEDIERIEVTRSPSAATYGANSFQAVVNIITKAPAETHGLAANARSGSLGTRDGFVRGGMQMGKTALRVSAGHMEDDGFDRNLNGGARRDSTRLNRATLRMSSELSADETLEVQAGIVRAELESEFADPNQLSFPDREQQETHVLLDWTRYASDEHKVRVKAYAFSTDTDRRWRSCYPTILFSSEMRAMHAANPEYAAAILRGQMPTGGTPEDDALALAVFARFAALGQQALAPTCGDVQEDYQDAKYDLELEDTTYWSERLRLVTGIGYRRDRNESQTFLNGTRTNDSMRAFFSGDYHATERIVVNLGGMWEAQRDYWDDVQFSPRAALNYHVRPDHTLRLIYARAVRTPDLLESDRDWSYYATQLDPPYQGQSETYFYYRAQASGELRPEVVESREASYYGAINEWGLSWDLKVFEERLSHLISEKLQFTDYHPTNSNRALIRGAEVEMSYRPERWLRTGLSYAYLDNEATSVLEQSLHARHSGSAYIACSTDRNWVLTLAYFGHSDIRGFSYDRYDVGVAKILQWNRAQLRLALLGQYFGSAVNGFTVDENFSVKNVYDDQWHYYGSLQLRY